MISLDIFFTSNKHIGNYNLVMFFLSYKIHNEITILLFYNTTKTWFYCVFSHKKCLDFKKVKINVLYCDYKWKIGLLFVLPQKTNIFMMVWQVYNTLVELITICYFYFVGVILVITDNWFMREQIMMLRNTSDCLR